MNVATKAPIPRGERTILSSVDTSLLIFAPLAVIIYNLYYHPFSPFPGPPLASIWPGWCTWRNYPNLEDLHEEYGPTIRISPDIISVDDPGYVKYLRIRVNSSEWLPFAHQEVVLSVRSPESHTELSKRGVLACSVGTVKLWEGVVDCKIREWIRKLKAEYGSGGVRFDLSEWARHLSVDLVGLVVFGVDMGCTQNGEDNEGRIQEPESRLWNAGVLAGFRTVSMALACNSFNPNISVVKTDREGPEAIRMKARIIIDAAWKSRGRVEARGEEWHINSEYATQGVTMLEKTMSAENPDGAGFAKEEVYAKCFPLFLAGQDSTAFAITSTLKLLFANPRVLATLLSEFATYYSRKPLLQIPCWTDIEDPNTKLPYLSAVLRESLRFNPAFLMSFPRVVTSSGIALTHRNGLYTLPGGLQISLDPMVVCRNKGLFGEDVHRFRPERWLERNGERIKVMEAAGFGWGAGSSDCFGKALAQMIVSKAVAMVLRSFEVELAVGYSRGDVWNLEAMEGSRAPEFWVKVKSKEWPGAERERDELSESS